MKPDIQPQPPPSYGEGNNADLAGLLTRGRATGFRVREDAPDGDIGGALKALLASLNDLDIPFVLVGGLALVQHVETRNTEDIDLIIARGDVSRIPDLVVLDQNEWFAAARRGPVPVDFLFTTNPLFDLVAKAHAEPIRFGQHAIRCATPKGLLLLKLFALPSLYRQGRIERADLYENDILMLLRRYPCDPQALLEILSTHMLPSDLRALGQVLEEINRRLQNPPPFS